MTLDVHPQLLRALVAVLRTGSFTAASEETGFTQSALSKQIGALEAAVGLPLFDRGPRGVVATPAALRLARHATVVLDHLDAAAREVAALDGPLLGRVVLGGFATTAMRLVPEAIALVRREHASVDVTFLESSTPVQIRRLRAGRLDLAILAVGTSPDEYDLTGLETEVLPAGPLHVAVGRRHRLAHVQRLTVDDLADEDWVVGRGARGDPQFGAWPTLPQPRVVAEIGEWSSRLGFVAAGLGITTVPSLALAALPAGVVAVPVDGTPWTRRSLRLASVGGLDEAARAVRSALRTVALEIAGGAAG
ncbi:DNA-binding transcriptional regulator, LysR family [Rathayibacter oskolensis]|uniref:DNA-binding transcriptional regulator, LysR family n=1 Tax=Rathayibacter oskolensis TaxID=1891671 RepID=A0A1X7PIC4_9MICO|nr:LysR family transcriptional regulator [Rathayibacter oskolensis]SMH51100.1 DNA-binding transcriptional regulator, LysR family [Rathayibacter oskolensis]